MPSTIVLFASGRPDGNTARLVQRIADAVGIEIVDLTEKSISPFDYEHRNRNDDFEPLMDHVLGFDQIIFASPVYWYAVAAPMKTFIDRISDLLDLPELTDQGRRLRGKTAYIVCTSVYDEVPAPFEGALRETFNYLGMQYGGCLHANCADGYVDSDYEEDVSDFINKLGA